MSKRTRGAARNVPDQSTFSATPAPRSLGLVAGLAAALAGVAVGHPDTDDQTPGPIPLKVYHAPSRMPDRIVLTWTGDPKTTQSVTWRTSTVVGEQVAEIAEATHGPEFARATDRVIAQTTPFTSDLSNSLTHRATFTGLKPGTVYAYRVGDGHNWSEWFQFRTEPAEPEPFSFVYFGDAQNDIRSLWSRVLREAFRDAPRAAFLLHAGDLVNRANSDAEWGEWFGAATWINATVPVIATPGNHEYVKTEQADGSETRALTPNWSASFTYPDHGPSEVAQTAYYIDYGNLRVISLNSNENHETQRDWLDAVLAENDQQWTAVTFHHPVYSMGKDRDNKQLRELWKPIFDKHGVDIVLTGHDHTYGRSTLTGPNGTVGVNDTTGTRAVDGVTGTIYVVSVSGPKMYNLQDRKDVQIVRRAADTQLYQVIVIDGDELRYEARTAIGTLYDAFTLRKRPGQPNELIERTPDMPARDGM